MTSEKIKLIQRAQKGDVLALARLHHIYYQDVYRYFYYRIDGERLIEDLTAGLFNRMATRISLFKSESSSFQAWLFSLAHSLMLEELLKINIRYRDTTFSGYEGESWGQPAGRLKRRLAKLTADERDVIIGKLIENHPAREVSREIGHAVGVVLALQGCGLAKLAQAELGADEPEETRRRFCHQLEDALTSEEGFPTEAALLERFPQNGPRLVPLVAQAREIRSTPNPEPPAGALAASKVRMMENLDLKKTLGAQHKMHVMDHLGTGLRQRRGRRLALAILALAVIFVLLSTISVSAIYALPGSWLYPAKLRLEEAHIFITLDPVARIKLATHYQRLRVEDLQTAVELGRFTIVEMQATLTAMPTAASINQ